MSAQMLRYTEPSGSTCRFEVIFNPDDRSLQITPLDAVSSGHNQVYTGTFSGRTLSANQALEMIRVHYYPTQPHAGPVRFIYAEFQDSPIRFELTTPPTVSPSYRRCEFRVTHYPSDNRILLEPIDTPNSGISEPVTVPYYSSTLNNAQITLLIRDHYYPVVENPRAATFYPDDNTDFTLRYREPINPDGTRTTCQFRLRFHPSIHQVHIHPINYPNSGVNGDYVANYLLSTLNRVQARELIKEHYYSSETQSESRIHRIHRQGEMLHPNRRRRWLTLMPYSSFQKTARCLTDRDLKLMRSVSLRVLWYLTENLRPRRKAAEMWRGYEQALIRYGRAVAKELRHRGFKDTSFDKWKVQYVKGAYKKPQWVYWPALRKSHRQYLVLRAYRFVIAKACHGYSRHVPNQFATGLRDILRSFGCNNLRNSTRGTLDDVWRDLLSSPAPIERFQNHYAQFNWDVLANEEFVFPES